MELRNTYQSRKNQEKIINDDKATKLIVTTHSFLIVSSDNVINVSYNLLGIAKVGLPNESILHFPM